MKPEQPIEVEVAYALPELQVLLSIVLPADSTAQSAIEISGILERFPEIDLSKNLVGVFGSVCSLDQKLHAGDRVEIYRPLIHDPKEARRIRAERNTRSAGKKVRGRGGSQR